MLAGFRAQERTQAGFAASSRLVLIGTVAMHEISVDRAACCRVARLVSKRCGACVYTYTHVRSFGSEACLVLKGQRSAHLWSLWLLTFYLDRLYRAAVKELNLSYHNMDIQYN